MAGLSPPWAESRLGDGEAPGTGLYPSGGPLDVHTLIPSSCECYHTWQKGLCRCDYVKGLEMGDCLGSSGGPVYSQRSLTDGRGRQEKERE